MKIRPYNTLLTYLNRGVSIESDKRYSFGVRSLDKKTLRILSNMPVNITVSELLLQSEDFESFYEKCGDKATQVGFIGRTLMYRVVKNLTLK